MYVESAFFGPLAFLFVMFCKLFNFLTVNQQKYYSSPVLPALQCLEMLDPYVFVLILFQVKFILRMNLFDA